MLAHALCYAIERKRMEVALRHSRDSLAHSNRQLEQFTQAISYDLQEPLLSVTGFIQRLAKHFQGQLDQDANELIVLAVEGTKRMSDLITDLLKYSRMGNEGEVWKLVDCERLLTSALTDLHLQIAERGAIITHDPLPTVTGDEEILSVLFQNLIDNAIKFSKPDQPPRIHLSAEHSLSNLMYRFRVRDNGIGIDPSHFDKIFTLFQRLNTREAYPGTGIGLTICKKVVEQHGGRIWVESTPNAGSTFYFTIPTYQDSQVSALDKYKKGGGTGLYFRDRGQA